MQYLNALKGVFYGEAVQRLYASIPSQRVSPSLPQSNFEPEKSYLRIWLNDMYLSHRRVLYQTRYPLVHAYCRFLYKGQMQEVPLIASPSQIEGLASATDRVLNLNYRLLGPLPFRGGELELLLGLFAVEAADYGKQFLDVLGSLSELTVSGEFKIALQFLKPLKSGVEAFFGMGKVKPQLGVHDSFAAGTSAPNPLSSGYRVLIDTAHAQVDLNQLWVKNGRLFTGRDLESARPFEGADYFLFNIEKLDSRDDFSLLPSLNEAWEEALSKARSSDEPEVDLAFQGFKDAALNSPDLLLDDTGALIKKLAETIKKIRRLRARRQFVDTLETGIDAVMAAAPAESGPSLDRSQLLQLTWK